MVELLTTYDLSEILMFIVLFAIAFKAVSSFIDWARDKRKKITLKEMQPDELAKQIAQETKDREQQIQELKIQREKEGAELRQQIVGIAAQVSNLTDKINLLVESDKDDIKAFIKV